MTPEQKIEVLKQILAHIKNWHERGGDYTKCFPESAQAALKTLFPRGLE